MGDALTAPVGAEVGLYVDLAALVASGDVIETMSGRRYYVIGVRVQKTGKHRGRQHLRAVVMRPTDHPPDARIHRIRWYPRARATRRRRA